MADNEYEVVKHRYTENDTGPPLICTYTDSTGTAIDITGWTITLHVDRPTSVLTVTATLSDPTNGIFQFGDPWGATDFVPGFGQVAEIQLVDLSGVIVTAPKFVIDVEREIA